MILLNINIGRIISLIDVVNLVVNRPGWLNQSTLGVWEEVGGGLIVF